MQVIISVRDTDVKEISILLLRPINAQRTYENVYILFKRCYRHCSHTSMHPLCWQAVNQCIHQGAAQSQKFTDKMNTEHGQKAPSVSGSVFNVEHKWAFRQTEVMGKDIWHSFKMVFILPVE